VLLFKSGGARAAPQLLPLLPVRSQSRLDRGGFKLVTILESIKHLQKPASIEAAFEILPQKVLDHHISVG
jgi:hypothetical protein